MGETITCSMCGFRFDPSGRSACPACPLNPTCKLVCCPNCGASDMSITHSSWVKRIKKLFSEGNHDPAIS